MRIWSRIGSALRADCPLSGTEGSVAVEYGILLPALLLFVFAIIDGGQLFWLQSTLERAVDAAARCGAIDVNNCGTNTQIQNFAVAQAFAMNAPASAFTPSVAACGRKVTATFTFTPSIPLLGSNGITLTSSACYSIPAS